VREQLVLGGARGIRHSGGHFNVNQVPTGCGTILVSQMIQRAKTLAFDDQARDTARVKAIYELTSLRPPDLRDFDLEPSPEVRRGLRSNRPVAGGCRDT